VNVVTRLRPGLSMAAAACALGVLLPPVGMLISKYVWAQSLQYVVLGVAVPALLMLGAPWRLQLSSARPPGTGRADRIARARSRRGGRYAWAYLIVFMAAAIFWRLPAVVDALAKHQVLVLAEVVTLVPAGCGLWLELVDSPPMLPRISRPLRASFAAVAMWTIWVLAYIMAFSHRGYFAAYVHAGHGLSSAADQQIAAGIMWLIPALSFPVVVYASMLAWLRDSADPDEELAEAAAERRGPWRFTPRPPRGWRTPPPAAG
jgi:cytochrome c oxidase assembly factor CtaG